MADKLLDGAEFRFVQTNTTGTVHINIFYPAWATSREPSRLVASGGAAFLQMTLTPSVTRCGLRTYPWDPNGPYTGVARFADEDLCRACYRSLHEDDQPRAFEHDRPDTA
ncbi:hypothetical protein ACWGQT_00675 [Streptomyces yangpuensis]